MNFIFLLLSFFPIFLCLSPFGLMSTVVLSNSSILCHRPSLCDLNISKVSASVVKIEFENKLLSKRHQKCDAQFLTCFSPFGKKKSR